jgi:aldehyde dehydrogenase (NAD+)
MSLNIHSKQFYIDGRWVDPLSSLTFTKIVNPANKKTLGVMAVGSAIDVDAAVASARRAFDERVYSDTTIDERILLLRRICEVYKTRMHDLAMATTNEMGCPISLSESKQVCLPGNILYKKKD